MGEQLPTLGCALEIEVVCVALILGVSFSVPQVPFGCRGPIIVFVKADTLLLTINCSSRVSVQQ